MSITLTQHINTIEISNASSVKALEIDYSGSIIADITGNVISGMNSSKIIILFLDDPQELLMTYNGNFDINQVRAYSKDKELLQIELNTITDNFSAIDSKWDESTTTYENYNRTNKYIPKQKSLLSFKINGEQKYYNPKGEVDTQKVSKSDLMKLNRIRGNYGVKQK